MGNGNEPRLRLRQRLEELRRRHGLIDPNIGNAFETDLQRVSLAAAAATPNRLTVIVPTDHAEMNLGQAFAGRDKLDDQGICFRTDTHIDFRTTKAPTRTVVTMGEPATKAVQSYDGNNLPQTTVGYGMGTESAAYRVANHRVYLMSNTKDIVVRAASDKAAVLQCKEGHLLVNAGHDIGIAGADKVLFGAGASGVVTPAWDTPWATDRTTDVLSMCSNAAGTMLGFAGTAVASWSNLNLPIELANDMEPGSTTKPSTAPNFQKLGTVMGAVADAAWVGGHSVRAHATKTVLAVGMKSANMWGNVSANLISPGIAVVMGTVADALGSAHAGVWGGVEAGFCSLKKVIVNSTYGAIETYGKNEVAMCSNGDISVEGMAEAHLSADHETLMYGKRDASILSDKHGLKATPNYVTLSLIDDRGKLFSYSQEDTHIKVGMANIQAQLSGDTQKLRIDKQGVNFSFNGSTEVDLNTSRVLWKGTMHRLGT